MPYYQPDSVRYYTFDSLDEEDGLIHAIFTRQGGVSPEPWDSLNLGGTVGDSAVRVAENRRRVFDAIGRSPDSLYDVWQVHSADVVFVDAPRPAHQPHLKADAMLTDVPGVTLFMRFADCVPILLYDPHKRALGLVHAGWQGTVRQTAAAAVEAMQARYLSRPADILAAIGPSIGPHHYQVGQDVIDRVQETFGKDALTLLPTSNGAVKFDLWSANRLILERLGVHQIEVSGICTACHLQDWYSHRGEGGKTGRFGMLAGLSG
ncbi:MAG: peptidoglycan editing factor PgeF [Chloroflexota bacterium]|nr:MAG: peptidoglycan editing factor PgeF [Chloroflexota bacterium]